ncbi:hypothetical protein [Laspinema olomoucense]|uniref:hypothetical protein n=1 Tax=Laspinema olomoucense TaxID=3231600 RepID=UPI0021BA6B5C|nr:hypothetical protein [Laspinema sp. D3a]
MLKNRYPKQGRDFFISYVTILEFLHNTIVYYFALKFLTKIKQSILTIPYPYRPINRPETGSESTREISPKHLPNYHLLGCYNQEEKKSNCPLAGGLKPS